MKQKSQIKSVLKKENQNKDSKAKSAQLQRFDRKGQEIRQGAKYEVTINEKIEIIQLMSDRNHEIHFDEFDLPRSPHLYNNNDTITDVSKNAHKRKQKLELDPKEEQFLKMLNQNLEKNRKKAQNKQCCIVQ